ncbi:MAG: hypothetical protein N2746_07160 [Deltaproteobacteria bacterium]|nr:hypothetical protein [Deltaproteobacteria bacterium]
MKMLSHISHIGLFLFITIVSIFYVRCSVDIEGAPCDPQLDNCPSGQYCSEEGICRFGNKDIKSVVKDAVLEDKEGFKDIKEDTYLSDTVTVSDTLLEDEGDIHYIEDEGDIGYLDADVNYTDISVDVYLDAGDTGDIRDIGCTNECNGGEKLCVSEDSIKECIFNNNTGCYEWSSEKFCNTPPQNKCMDSHKLRVFSSKGKCASNQCIYEYKEIDCEYGCENGMCKNCTPDCLNKQCGDDGCGGSCGNCNDNAYCSEYRCKCYKAYGNCDNDWENGCEVDLESDVNNCGECNNVCEADKSITICYDKICKIKSCEYPYGDCNGEYSDGCEEELTSVSHCGSCENDCTKKGWDRVSEYRCIPTVIDEYVCDISMCELNYANCNNKSEDGCEAYIIGDVKNCGRCGNVCDADKMNVVTPSCKNGSCDYDKCRVAWEDENDSRSDGCEKYNYFPKTYGVRGIDEEVSSTVIPIKGGGEGFFFVGNSGSYILAVKLDVNGNISWAKRIGYVGYAYYSTNAILDVDANGDISYLILGSVRSLTTDKDLLVLKLSDKGELLWRFVYGTVGSSEEATAILKDRGNYFIVGNQIKNNISDILVVKLNNNNQIVWSNAYSYNDGSNPSTNISEYAYSIYRTSDGYYLIGGSTSLNGYDFLMVLLKDDGGVSRAVNFGGSGGDYGKVFIPVSNGYIIGGFTDSSSFGGNDVAVIFYNKDFTGYWAYIYGDNRPNILIDMSILDNGYIVSGQTESESKSYEGMLIRISDKGDVVWQRSYGGSKWDVFARSMQVSDGGIISIGRSISFTSDYDLWIVKTDRQGIVPGNCPSGFSNLLSFSRKLFSLNFREYPIKSINQGNTPPSASPLSVEDVGLNVNMQCSAP